MFPLSIHQNGMMVIILRVNVEIKMKIKRHLNSLETNKNKGGNVFRHGRWRRNEWMYEWKWWVEYDGGKFYSNFHSSHHFISLELISLSAKQFHLPFLCFVSISLQVQTESHSRSFKGYNIQLDYSSTVWIGLSLLS